jgi:glyoxylase-like metal-dependent hydrolase (beta-lactamase superfamily II)
MNDRNIVRMLIGGISLKITENVFQLEAAKRSHVFLVRTDETFLIDTGMPGLSKKILEEIRSLGTCPDDIRMILLTHHDVDHIGNAKQLQEATGAELWAPSEDIPYIIGEKRRPGVKHLIETIIRPRKSAVSGTYSAGWPYSDIHILRAPGHTPGHTIFQVRDIVFTGDLFKFIHGRFALFPGFMNWNQDEVIKSLSMLKNLEFEWLCPSHGSPVHNGPELQDFLSKLK